MLRRLLRFFAWLAEDSDQAWGSVTGTLMAAENARRQAWGGRPLMLAPSKYDSDIWRADARD